MNFIQDSSGSAKTHTRLSDGNKLSRMNEPNLNYLKDYLNAPLISVQIKEFFVISRKLLSAFGK